MEDIFDLFSYSLLPTFVGVALRMDEFARLYMTSVGFTKPSSFVTQCGPVKRFVDYDFQEGHKDFPGGLQAMFKLTKSNPAQQNPPTKTSITVKKDDLINTVSAHKSILDGVVLLVTEQNQNKTRELLNQVACWIAHYYTEVAAELLSDSGDYEAAVFKLPIDEMLTALMGLRSNMREDFQIFLKLFKPNIDYSPNFSEIIDNFIYPYLRGVEDLKDSTFKPLVYYLLDYMKAYNKIVRTTRMPFDIDDRIIDGKLEMRYTV